MPANPFALTDATVWIGAVDATTSHNQVDLSVTANELDATTFGGNGYRNRIAGFKDVRMSHEGFVEYANPDQTFFSDLATTDRLVTVSPTGAQDAVTYSFRGVRLVYTPLQGAAGEVASFSGEVANSNSNGLVRGRLIRPKASVSSTGNGTGYQLGAVAATQYLYAGIHIFSAGTTITLVLESDNNSGFSSATTRATIGPLTATGGTWMTRVAGAITDDYYRLRISAITGTFSLAGWVGIGS